MVAKCVISNANSLRWFDQVQAPCEKQTFKAVSRRPIRIHGQNISSKGKAEPYIAAGFNFRSSYWLTQEEKPRKKNRGLCSPS